MAYEKFALNFTLIKQIVFEIITNQFTTFPVAARLAHLFCVPLIYLFKLLQTRHFYKFNFTIFLFLLILKTCLLKINCLYIYIERKKISPKNPINEFV